MAVMNLYNSDSNGSTAETGADILQSSVQSKMDYFTAMDSPVSEFNRPRDDLASTLWPLTVPPFLPPE